MFRQYFRLKRHVVAVIPGRLVAELDAAQRESVRVHVEGIDGNTVASVEPDERPVRQTVRRRVVRRLVDERELERVVVPEARITAAVLERAVEEPVP